MAGVNFGELSAHHTTSSTAAVTSLTANSALWVRAYKITATTESGSFAYHDAASSTTTPIFRAVIPAGTSPYEGYADFPANGFKCSTGLFVALTTAVNAITTIYST